MPITPDPSLEVLQSMGLKGSEYRKMWNKLHPDRMAAASKRWRENHPDKVREIGKLKYKKDKGKLERLRQEWRESGGRAKSNERYYTVTEKPKRGRKPWDVIDDCMVMERKITDRELSKIIGRTIRAIESRRFLLKNQNQNQN